MRAVRTVWGRLTGGERGYSLIELMITVAVLGVVLGALTTIFVSGSRAELDMNRRFQAQQDVRIAFGALRTDLHAASCAQAANAGTSVGLDTAASQLLIYSPSSYPAPATGPTSNTNCTANDAGVTAVPSEVWCAYQVTPSSVTRYALYRIATSACPTDAAAALAAGGVLETDNLNNGTALFTVNTPLSQQHVGVTANLSATIGTSAHADTYTLRDTIILRNSPRT